jgi:hypothetical protein
VNTPWNWVHPNPTLECESIHTPAAILRETAFWRTAMGPQSTTESSRLPDNADNVRTGCTYLVQIMGMNTYSYQGLQCARVGFYMISIKRTMEIPGTGTVCL